MTDILITMSDEDRATLAYEAETAKRDVRGDNRSASFWDGIVKDHGNGKSDPKRADIITTVLTVAGLAEDKPQKVDGVRTPYGNVVQKFGARFDAAVKRAEGETEKSVDWMRLVRQAVENAANKGGFEADRILSEVREVLRGENEDLTEAA